MNRIVIPVFMVMLFSFQISIGQTLSVRDSGNVTANTFLKTFGGKGDNSGKSVCKTIDGNLMIAGNTNSFGAGGYDGFIMKMNNAGNVLWSKTYGSYRDDYISYMDATADGDFIVLGQTKSFSDTLGKVWVFKINADGKLLWSKEYGVGKQDLIFGLMATSDGGCIFSGDHPGHDLHDGMIVKLNGKGKVIWSKGYDTRRSEQCSSLYEETDGIISTGQYQSNTYLDGYIMKLDKKTGAIKWIKGYDLDNRTNRLGEIFKKDGHYIITAVNADEWTQINARTVFITADTLGNILQAMESHTNPPIVNGPCAMTADGAITYAGGIEFDNDHEDVAIIRNKADGTVDWAKLYQRPGKQFSSYFILNDDDSTFISVGQSGDGKKSNDIEIIKTDLNGNIKGDENMKSMRAYNKKIWFEVQDFKWSSIYDLHYIARKTPKLIVKEFQFTVTN